MSRVRARTLQLAAILVTLGALALPAAASGAQKASEPTLKDRIQFGLETSTVVKKYDINVKVNGTEAILTGTVATDAQKAEAGRMAQVAGAVKIQNAIVVDKNVDVTLTERMKTGLSKTGDKITDAWITTKVKWFFWGDEQLKGSDINVDTADHVVTLKGSVKTTAGRTRAVQLASNTEGVKRVIDELTVGK